MKLLLCVVSLLLPALCTAAVSVNLRGLVVRVEGGKISIVMSPIAKFNGDCLVSVDWLLNGISVEELGMDNVKPDFFVDEFGVSFGGELLIYNISLENNNTIISLQANFSSGHVEFLRNFLRLLVQGLLEQGVEGLTSTRSADSTTISLTWRPPLTNVDPDIYYCVDVVNSTSSETLVSECVNVTKFSYPIPPGVDSSQLSFVVTPVNIAGRGPAESTVVTDMDATTETNLNSYPTVIGEGLEVTTEPLPKLPTEPDEAPPTATIIGVVVPLVIVVVVAMAVFIVVSCSCAQRNCKKKSGLLIDHNTPGTLSRTSEGGNCEGCYHAAGVIKGKLNLSEDSSDVPSDQTYPLPGAAVRIQPQPAAGSTAIDKATTHGDVSAGETDLSPSSDKMKDSAEEACLGDGKLDPPAAADNTTDKRCEDTANEGTADGTNPSSLPTDADVEVISKAEDPSPAKDTENLGDLDRKAPDDMETQIDVNDGFQKSKDSSIRDDCTGGDDTTVPNGASKCPVQTTEEDQIGNPHPTTGGSANLMLESLKSKSTYTDELPRSAEPPRRIISRVLDPSHDRKPPIEMKDMAQPPHFQNMMSGKDSVEPGGYTLC